MQSRSEQDLIFSGAAVTDSMDKDSGETGSGTILTLGHRS
jgi:hypothetical protein